MLKQHGGVSVPVTVALDEQRLALRANVPFDLGHEGLAADEEQKEEVRESVLANEHKVPRAIYVLMQTSVVLLGQLQSLGSWHELNSAMTSNETVPTLITRP